MIIYSYTYKLQGNGLDSWTRTQTENGEVVFVDMVFFLKAENWMLKSVLSEDSLLAQVETALDNLPEPQKTSARFAWDNSPNVSSNSSTTQFIQGVLGLTLDQTIDIFTRAQNFII